MLNNPKHSCLSRLQDIGITFADAVSLRRISMTLHRWYELECNGDIRRSELTGLPSWFSNGTNCGNVPDRELGALKRLAAIMAHYPELISYVQTDPRGCALYIMRREEAQPTDQFYNSRGIAVHK